MIDQIKENDIAKLRVNGRVRQVRVIDIVGSDAMIEHRSGGVSIVDVEELKPILEGCVSKAQERRLKSQLKLTEESGSEKHWFFDSQ